MQNGKRIKSSNNQSSRRYKNDQVNLTKNQTKGLKKGIVEIQDTRKS